MWGVHHISLKTKIAVYRAVVLTRVLYGCETWTLYRRSILRLDQLYLRCLRKIARVKWQDRISNTDVLNICGIMGIIAFLLKELNSTPISKRIDESMISDPSFRRRSPWPSENGASFRIAKSSQSAVTILLLLIHYFSVKTVADRKKNCCLQ